VPLSKCNKMKVEIRLISTHSTCRHYIGVSVTLPPLYSLKKCPLNRELDGVQGKSGRGVRNDNPVPAWKEILVIRLIREPIYRLSNPGSYNSYEKNTDVLLHYLKLEQAAWPSC
jgi:hypothetical protein